MTEERTYLDYIEDIRDAVAKVAEFIGDMTFEQFAADDKTAFAVIRAFEVLGEAAKSVPDSLRQQYDSIPWREMSQMRDKLIHHLLRRQSRGCLEGGHRTAPHAVSTDRSGVERHAG